VSRHPYISLLLFLLILPPPSSTLFPYTTLFRSCRGGSGRRRARRQPPTVFPTTAASGAGSPGRSDWERLHALPGSGRGRKGVERSEEHTSELQSRGHLVCRLLLEKKKKQEMTSE